MFLMTFAIWIGAEVFRTDIQRCAAVGTELSVRTNSGTATRTDRHIGWLDSLEGLLIMTAFQPWMILLFWFAAKRIDSSLFDSAICDGASNWVLFRKIYAPIVRPYVMIAAFLSIAESWNLLEQPMTFLQSKERYPLSMILMQLSTDNAELKNVLCLLFAVPLMILFCTMVKKIIDT